MFNEETLKTDYGPCYFVSADTIKQRTLEEEISKMEMKKSTTGRWCDDIPGKPRKIEFYNHLKVTIRDFKKEKGIENKQVDQTGKEKVLF